MYLFFIGPINTSNSDKNKIETHTKMVMPLNDIACLHCSTGFAVYLDN